mmetsp:Transcript_23919/g.43857  ORF Transcript_23919/g.43857 Transcript_23919/m.43857 type:complete len:348 (-) Transcript_23919:195-1238(-)
MALVAELYEQWQEKLREASTIETEIEEVRQYAEQLRLYLKAVGLQDESLIPRELRCGAGARGSHVTTEMERLVKFLAESVNDQKKVRFQAEGQMSVGDHTVMLGHMASWGLTGGLKLNCPVDLEEDLSSLMSRARRGLFNEEELLSLTRIWKMLLTEVVHDGSSKAAIFLLHQETEQAVIISDWPTINFPQVKKASGSTAKASSGFSPHSHFKQLLTTPSQPSSPLLKAEAPSLRDDECVVISKTLETVPTSAQSTKPPVAAGDRVEVKYQEQWFAGTLVGVVQDSGMLCGEVHCDIDAEGVLTYAPLSCIRSLENGKRQPVETKKQRWSRRCRSEPPNRICEATSR